MDRKLDWDVDVEGAVDMMDREEENIDNIGPVLQQLNSGFKTGPQPNSENARFAGSLPAAPRTSKQQPNECTPIARACGHSSFSCCPYAGSSSNQFPVYTSCRNLLQYSVIRAHVVQPCLVRPRIPIPTAIFRW